MFSEIKKKITLRDKLAIMMLSWADFLCFCSMSVMAPFYPKEASARGMSESVSGFVFGFYGLLVLLASPVAGKIVSVNHFIYILIINSFYFSDS